MKWITRERVKVDRVACPWLIKKFIDPDAEFLFVPTDEVMAVAERESAVPYDVKHVELGHHGKECAFDLDTGQLDQIIGVKGQANGGVYQFNVPRRDPIMGSVA